MKRMALSASSSASLRLLCHSSPRALHGLPISVSTFLPCSLSLSYSFFPPTILSLTLECAPSLLSDLQPRFFLRFFLELRPPRVDSPEDYLSSAKGRSRLNLKHHLNKREVTARLFPAGEKKERDEESNARAREREALGAGGHGHARASYDYINGVVIPPGKKRTTPPRSLLPAG